MTFFKILLWDNHLAYKIWLRCYLFRFDRSKAYPLTLGTETQSVYCHIGRLGHCGDGSWTLIIKINGTTDGHKLLQSIVIPLNYQTIKCNPEEGVFLLAFLKFSLLSLFVCIYYSELIHSYILFSHREWLFCDEWVIQPLPWLIKTLWRKIVSLKGEVWPYLINHDATAYHFLFLIHVWRPQCRPLFLKFYIIISWPYFIEFLPIHAAMIRERQGAFVK